MNRMIPMAAMTLAAASLVACASIPESGGAGYGDGGPDYSARPAYGSMSLSAGFANDPRVVTLRAGGNIDARTLHSHCRGFIARAPDVRVHYNAGSLPLIISVDSASDTTLVINGPDGSWYCDDDGGVNGLNPSVRFNPPQSGQYDIWVGTYESGALQSAQLHISELGSQ